MSSKLRIGRPKYSLALAHGASATTAQQDGNENGMLRSIIITTPATVDNSATVEVNILDVDGNTIWSKDTIAANTTDLTLLTSSTEVPIGGAYTVQVVFSDAQDTTDTVTGVVLLIDRG